MLEDWWGVPPIVKTSKGFLSELAEIPELLTQTLPTEKQPAERLIPFAKVDDADEVFVIEPPVIVRPLEEARPAVVMPPAIVDVAVEVAFKKLNVGEDDAVKK